MHACRTVTRGDSIFSSQNRRSSILTNHAKQTLLGHSAGVQFSMLARCPESTFRCFREHVHTDPTAHKLRMLAWYRLMSTGQYGLWYFASPHYCDNCHFYGWWRYVGMSSNMTRSGVPLCILKHACIVSHGGVYSALHANATFSA